MGQLTAQALVQAWEWGQAQHPLDRTLYFLALAYPEQSWEHLARLSLGQRNLRIFALREQLFGSSLACYVACPECETGIEFTIQIADIRVGEWSEVVLESHSISFEGITVTFRLPTSEDLAAVVPFGASGHADETAQARQHLLKRCVMAITLADDQTAVAPLEVASLPEDVVFALTEAMIDLDPQADIAFNVDCEECAHNWSVDLDIAAYFWTEASALAQRLLADVHTLASAYGWAEADILAMSDIRRRFYLDHVHA